MTAPIRTFLTAAEIDTEFAAAKPTTLVGASPTKFSYHGLGASDFEWLPYALCSEAGSRPEFGRHDDVRVLNEGADRGRDLVLYAAGRPVGVVQCKRLSSAISCPTVLREIIKFLLFAQLDPNLMPESAGFSYALALAEDPAETVSDLFSETSRILNEEEPEIPGYVREVIKSYKSLAPLKAKSLDDKIVATLKQLKLKLLRPVDLDGLVLLAPGVQARFFGARLVTDNSLIKDLFEKQGTQFEGLAAKLDKIARNHHQIDDKELELFKQRIDGIPNTHRVAMGVAKVFGFPREMFAKQEDLKRFLDIIGRAKTESDQFVTEWLFAKSHTLADDICDSFQVAVMVHPFASQIPRAFLGTVTRDVLEESEYGLGGIAKVFVKRGPKQTDDEILEDVIARLLSNGRKVIRGDFSDFADPPHLFAQKRHVISQLANGLKSDADVDLHLRQGAKILRAQLDTAAAKLRSLGKFSRTVVVQNTAALDNSQELQGMADTVKALEAMKTPKPSQTS